MKRKAPKDKKEPLYRFMSRLYVELRQSGNITFKKLRGKMGTYGWNGDDEVAVDYRKDLLPTIIHEFLHKWHHDKSETWVRQEEKRIINALSFQQIRNFICVVAEVI